MSSWRQHCEILQVPEDANTGFIRRAYRIQALRRHPDVQGGSLAAKEDFQKLNQAYRYLLSNFRTESPKNNPNPQPAPPPKREFAGRGPSAAPFEERRKPESQRRTQPERRTESDRRKAVPKIEPVLERLQFSVKVPPCLGRLLWKLRFSRSMHRRLQQGAVALFVFFSLRAVWPSGKTTQARDLNTCYVSEGHLKGNAFALGTADRANCELRCANWKVSKSEAMKHWRCSWGEEEIP